MINYDETKEFSRDFKKLLKKFPSLIDDFEVSKQYRINLFHCQEIDSRGIFEIQGFSNELGLKFFKIKKFQCRCLKGRGAKSGIRITYAYFPNQNRVVFLEIYYKASQENENRRRIENFIASII